MLLELPAAAIMKAGSIFLIASSGICIGLPSQTVSATECSDADQTCLVNYL